MCNREVSAKINEWEQYFDKIVENQHQMDIFLQRSDLETNETMDKLHELGKKIKEMEDSILAHRNDNFVTLPQIESILERIDKFQEELTEVKKLV